MTLLSTTYERHQIIPVFAIHSWITHEYEYADVQCTVVSSYSRVNDQYATITIPRAVEAVSTFG